MDYPRKLDGCLFVSRLLYNQLDSKNIPPNKAKKMLALYRRMLPLLFIIFIAMGWWVSFLHFPWEWLVYVVMGLEVLAATVIMAMEYQAQHVGTASALGSFGFLGLNLSAACLLGIVRVLVWGYQKISL